MKPSAALPHPDPLPLEEGEFIATESELKEH